MKPRTAIMGLVVGGVLFAGVLNAVFQRRLARDLYPEYSSLRSDALGTRALHDALARLPGWEVERWMRDPGTLPAKDVGVIVVPGLPSLPGEAALSEDMRWALAAAMTRGARVVLAYRAEELPVEYWLRMPVEESDAKEANGKKTFPAENDENSETEALKAVVEDEADGERSTSFGFRPTHHHLDDWKRDTAATATGLAAGLPEALPWRGWVRLEADEAVDWRVLYEQDGQPVLLERSWGRGSLVVMATSFSLSNEALQRSRSTELLRWLLGEHRRVVFMETHLGVREDPGIAALARRYGLQGAAFCGGVLVLLWAWRRLALFLPAPEEPETAGLTYDSTVGLAALLRRAVPRAELIKTCEAEWARTARPTDRERVAGAVATGGTPEEIYNRASRTLRPGRTP